MKSVLRLDLLLVAILLLGGLQQRASATTYSWVNAKITSWSDTTGWSGGVAPVSNLDNILNFAISLNTTATNDLGTVQLNRLVGTNTSSSNKNLTVAGSSGNNLNFVTNSSSTLPTMVLTNNSVSGALSITIPFTVTNALTITNSGSRGAAISGAITNTGGMTFDGTGAGAITLGGAGVISGVGGINYGGSYTVTASGANTYQGGTTISAGTLKIGNAKALGDNAGAASVSSGAVLDMNGITMTNTNALTLNGTGIASGGALINSSATAGTYAGLVTLGSASSMVAGTGNIILSNTGTITGSGYGLTLDGTATGSSIAGIIGTGAGTVTKQGTGTWTLSGANTYSGSTTISGGTLALGSSGTFANSPVIVVGDTGSSGAVLDLTSKGSFVFGTGQTVKGIGTINIGSGKTVTINGSLAPGNSPGILSVTGDLVLATAASVPATGAITTMELGGSGGVAGTDYDQLAVSGQLSFGGTLNVISYNSYSLAQAGTYHLFTFGSETGNFDFVSVAGTSLSDNTTYWHALTGGYDYTFTLSTGDLVVSALASVPEPSTYAMLAGVLALGMVVLRRRRTRTD